MEGLCDEWGFVLCSFKGAFQIVKAVSVPWTDCSIHGKAVLLPGFKVYECVFLVADCVWAEAIREGGCGVWEVI